MGTTSGRTYTRTYTQQPTYTSTSTRTTYGSSQPYQSGQRWSYDGQTMFSSYGECNEARRGRTLAGGGLGALAGAALGAMAGGDDTRNAAIGAVIGGAAGAYTGQRSIQ